VYPTLPAFECLYQSLWNFVYTYIMALKPVSAAYFVIRPISLCFCVCSVSLLGNGSVGTFPQQWTHRKKQNSWTRHFLCGPCRIKGESVGLSVYPHIVTSQWIGKHTPVAMKNYWTRRFLCGPCRIKGESVGFSVYPHIVTSQWIGKHIPVAMKNYWTRRFLCGPCHIKRM
jgi:hypothetical protein